MVEMTFVRTENGAAYMFIGDRMEYGGVVTSARIIDALEKYGGDDVDVFQSVEDVMSIRMDVYERASSHVERVGTLRAYMTDHEVTYVGEPMVRVDEDEFWTIHDERCDCDEFIENSCQQCGSWFSEADDVSMTSFEGWIPCRWFTPA